MYSSFRFISLSVMSALVAVSCKKMCMNHDYEPATSEKFFVKDISCMSYSQASGYTCCQFRWQNIRTRCQAACFNNPVVIGWQIDNEPSHYNFSYDYGKNARKNFRELLQRKYKTIDRLKLTSR